MKKIIFNNLALKIISVFAAFLIWLMVVNGDDPEISQSYKNIKVTPMNEESFIEVDKVYDVKDGTNVVTVRVRARRSMLSRVTMKDFTVIADMENITLLNTVPLKVVCSNPAIPQENIDIDPPSMKIVIEDKEEKPFMVSVLTNGQPETGYEIGSEKVSEGDSIILEGPGSLLDIIDKVTASVNVASIVSDQRSPAKLRVFDRNGAEFNESQMERLVFKTTGGRVLSETLVNVNVVLWKVRSNIALDVKTLGEPAKGYRITGITTTPSTVSLAGAEDTLKELNGKLTLEDAVDIAEATGPVEKKIDVTEYLQEHYKKALKQETNAPDTISVKVQIEKIGTTTLNFPISEMKIENMPVGMDITLTPADKIPVEVRALSDDAPAITVKDIQAVLDLSSYQTEGNPKVIVKISLPPTYELVKDVTIAVNLVKNELKNAVGGE